MSNSNIVAFLARQHGLNALQTLLQERKYKILYLFTHRLKPKSEDAQQSERDDFADYVKLAQHFQIPLFSVDSKADNEKIKSLIEGLPIDFIVSVSWRRLIPSEILNLAKKGCINLHRGLLPNYPGAEPIKQALLHKDKNIYITAHEMVEEIDAGKSLVFYKHPTNYDEKHTLDENILRLRNEITPHFGPLLLKALEEKSHQRL